MSNNWINPLYAEQIARYEQTTTPITYGNCSNCGGTGRIIYIDPSDGSMRDIPCGACGGSGQTA